MVTFMKFTCTNSACQEVTSRTYHGPTIPAEVACPKCNSTALVMRSPKESNIRVPSEYQVKDLHEALGSYVAVADFLNAMALVELAWPHIVAMDIHSGGVDGHFDDDGESLVWDGEFVAQTRYHNGKAIDVLIFSGNSKSGGPESGKAIRYVWDDDIILMTPI